MTDPSHQYECTRSVTHQVTNHSWPNCAYCKQSIYLDIAENFKDSGSALWTRRYIVEEELVG